MESLPFAGSFPKWVLGLKLGSGNSICGSSTLGTGAQALGPAPLLPRVY